MIGLDGLNEIRKGGKIIEIFKSYEVSASESLIQSREWMNGKLHDVDLYVGYGMCRNE